MFHSQRDTRWVGGERFRILVVTHVLDERVDHEIPATKGVVSMEFTNTCAGTHSHMSECSDF